MAMKKGQISTEYLIVVGFVTFLIISVVGLAFFYSGSITDRIKLDQIQNFANKIISSAEQVFYAGEPSRVVINAYLPSGVEQIEIVNNDLVFNVSTSSGLTRIAFPGKVQIEGALSLDPGVKRINVVALSDRVQLIEG